MASSLDLHYDHIGYALSFVIRPSNIESERGHVRKMLCVPLDIEFILFDTFNVINHVLFGSFTTVGLDFIQLY